MAEKARVFLSYRRADTQHAAGRAGDKLSERFDLFMDIDTVPPGVDFTDYVRRAVSRCDVLLAFIGEQWLTLTDEHGRPRIADPNDLVAEEIRVALSRGVRVIPVLVEDAEMPTAGQLPEPLRPLVNRNALPLRHRTFSADLARLIAGIEHARTPETQLAGHWDAGTTDEPPPITVPDRIPGRPRARRPWLIGLAVLVLVALLGIGWTQFRPERTGVTAPDPSTIATLSVPPSSAPPSTTITPAATLSSLQARIPRGFRRTCTALKPEADALRRGLLAAAQCAPDARSGGARIPAYTFYFSYPDPAATIRAYRGYYARGDLASGDCLSEPAELPYTKDGLSGTLRCYTDAEGFRVLAWTADELAILASVADRDMSYAELYRWWHHAGPVR